jgi:AbiV family abortive infection protein
MNAAGRNAERLCDDASLLLQEARYPSAAALAALSIEEAGKLSILRRLAVARDEEEVAECWRNYRWHTKKNIAWLLPQLVADGARRLDDFSPLFDGESDHPELLDQVKQISFYSDCLGIGIGLSPRTLSTRSSLRLWSRLPKSLSHVARFRRRRLNSGSSILSLFGISATS